MNTPRGRPSSRGGTPPGRQSMRAAPPGTRAAPAPPTAAAKAQAEKAAEETAKAAANATGASEHRVTRTTIQGVSKGPPGAARGSSTRSSFRMAGLGPGGGGARSREHRASIQPGGAEPGKDPDEPVVQIREGRVSFTTRGGGGGPPPPPSAPEAPKEPPERQLRHSSMLRRVVHQKVSRESGVFANRGSLARQRAATQRRDEGRLRFKLVDTADPSIPVVDKELTYGLDDMHTWWKVLKSATAAFAPCPDGLELYQPLVGPDPGTWLKLLNDEIAWDTLEVEEMVDDVSWARGLDAWRDAERRAEIERRAG